MFDRNCCFRKLLLRLKSENIVLNLINIVFTTLFVVILSANIYLWLLKSSIDSMYSAKYESTLFYNLNKFNINHSEKIFLEYDLNHILGGDLILKVKYFEKREIQEGVLAEYINLLNKENWNCVEAGESYVMFQKSNLIILIKQMDNKNVELKLASIHTTWGRYYFNFIK